MRSTSMQFAATAVLVCGLSQLGLGAGMEDGPRSGAKDDRMAAIIAAVRAEEAKYRE